MEGEQLTQLRELAQEAANEDASAWRFTGGDVIELLDEIERLKGEGAKLRRMIEILDEIENEDPGCGECAARRDQEGVTGDISLKAWHDYKHEFVINPLIDEYNPLYDELIEAPKRARRERANAIRDRLRADAALIEDPDLRKLMLFVMAEPNPRLSDEELERANDWLLSRTTKEEQFCLTH